MTHTCYDTRRSVSAFRGHPAPFPDPGTTPLPGRRAPRVARRAPLAALGTLIVAATLGATPAAAQEARTDSLEARVRRLTVLVDSLLAELREQTARQEEEQPGGLEALRAAAREAASETPPPDTTPQPSRTRNLSVLNPEISVTGDVVGGFAAPGGGDNRVSAIPREFEFSFISALDPYARAKVFVSKEEEVEIAGLEDAVGMETGLDEPQPAEGPPAIELEEGYGQWVGLPGNLGVKLGKFRHELGLYNRWHTHALFEIERPLATAAFLGDDGLIQTGLSVDLPSFQIGPATQTITLEAAKADNKLFEGGTNFSYVGRLQSFFDVSPSTYVQFGVNGVYGKNDDVDLTARLLSVDAVLRWVPIARAKYREFSLKSEWYWVDRDVGPQDLSGRGGYAQASFRWDQRWITGLRADYLDGFGDGPTAYALVPSVTYWQSEWVRFRLQYDFIKRTGFDGDHTIMFQTVWAVGPHKHETY